NISIMDGLGRQSKGNACALFLRVLALLLNLAAAIVLGVDKVIPFKILPTLPPLNIPVTSKWHYLSAFVFFMVANIISCAYGVISLLFSILNKDENIKILGFMIITLDVVIIALLSAGNGAAFAVGLVAYQGNSHVQWNKACNVFDKFCLQGSFAVTFSLLGSLAYLLLVLAATFSLHKKT
ncbi:DUF588 domain-containing protein, partial [Cephalotus follicularis]